MINNSRNSENLSNMFSTTRANFERKDEYINWVTGDTGHHFRWPLVGVDDRYLHVVT